MKHDIDVSRRRLLQHAVIGIAMVPLAALPLRSAQAADAPLVGADDATAKAVSYVDDAGKSKTAKPGSKCGNCALYQGGAGSTQGGCPIFPGKSVKATGWCSSWTAKG
jgi:hypothetical protein